MIAGPYKMMSDLHVEVVDSVDEGDKVMVRNIWTGTTVETGKRTAFHGIVLWRVANGKLVERPDKSESDQQVAWHADPQVLTIPPSPATSI